MFWDSRRALAFPRLFPTPDFPQGYLSDLVKAFRHVIALFLLALWLPATQHCDLEAAGIMAWEEIGHTHAESSCKQSCETDVCPTVEGASYNPASHLLRVLPPDVFVVLHLIDLLPAPLVIEDQEAFFTGDPPELQKILRTWQFSRRTALPARAPDLIAS